jgi:hypothetical protein
LCTFFSGGWASALFSFLRKKQNNRFLHWYKKAGRERNRKGWGGRKTDCWARAYPGSRSRGFESGQCFFVQELVGRAGAFCVLYHGRE